MCIAIYKRTVVGGMVSQKVEGQDAPIEVHQNGPAVLTREMFDDLDSHHPHGVGLMWADGEKVRFHKTALDHSNRHGFFVSSDELDRIYDQYKALDEGGVDTVLHFRFATHGKGSIEKMEENCHPFYVPDTDEKLAYCHNGVISIKTPSDDSISDSRMFGDRVLGMLKPEFRRDAVLWDVLERFLGGSKVILMDHEARVDILNESKGVWSDGVWYSNDSFRSSWQRRTTGGRGRGHHQQHFPWDGDDGYGASVGNRVWIPTKHKNKHGQTVDVGPQTLGIKLNNGNHLCRLCMEYGTKEGGVAYENVEALYRSESRGQKCSHCTLGLAYVLNFPKEAEDLRTEILSAERLTGEFLSDHRARLDACVDLYQNHTRLVLPDVAAMETFSERLDAAMMDGAFINRKNEKAVYGKIRRVKTMDGMDDVGLAIAFFGMLSQDEWLDASTNEIGLSLLCDATAIVLGSDVDLSPEDAHRVASLMRRSTARIAQIEEELREANAKKEKKEREEEERKARLTEDRDRFDRLVEAHERDNRRELAATESPVGAVRRVPSILNYIDTNPGCKPFKIKQRGGTKLYENLLAGEYEDMDLAVADRGWWIIYTRNGDRLYIPAAEIDGARKRYGLFASEEVSTHSAGEGKQYTVTKWKTQDPEDGYATLARIWNRPTKGSDDGQADGTVEKSKTLVKV